MQSRRDPRLRLVLPHLEDTARRLCLRPDAPPGDECAREGGITEVDRKSVIQPPRIPEGIMAHPSAPQF